MGMGWDSLGIGESVWWRYGPLRSIFGKHSFTWIVDPDNEIKEANENNNRKTMSFFVKGKSKITCNLSKSVIKYGESIKIYGEIKPPRSNVEVRIVFRKPDGSRISKRITTNNDGTYAYIFKPDIAGSWTVTVSWKGDAEYIGDQDSKKFIVEKGESNIEILIEPDSLVIGDNLIIYGNLSPSLVGVNIEIILESPSGEIIKKQVTIRSPNGYFNYTFKPNLNGLWRIYAQWAGNNNYKGSVSKELSFKVFYEKTSISFTNNIIEVNYSDKFNISGTLRSMKTFKGIPNKTLFLVIYRGDNVYINQSTISDEKGRFHFCGIIRLTPNIYNFTLYFPGDTISFTYCYSSVHGSIIVRKENVQICSKTTLLFDINENNIINGTITDDDGEGLKGLNITLEIYDNGWKYLNSCISDDKGYFHIIISKMNIGEYRLRLVFGGNDYYKFCSKSISLVISRLKINRYIIIPSNVVSPGTDVYIAVQLVYEHNNTPVSYGLVQITDLGLKTTNKTGWAIFHVKKDDIGEFKYIARGIRDKFNIIHTSTEEIFKIIYTKLILEIKDIRTEGIGNILVKLIVRWQHNNSLVHNADLNIEIHGLFETIRVKTIENLEGIYTASINTFNIGYINMHILAKKNEVKEDLNLNVLVIGNSVFVIILTILTILMLILYKRYWKKDEKFTEERVLRKLLQS